MAISTKPKPKQLAHHRKRTAAHHKQSKRYVKSYWPYIPVFMMVAVGLLANGFMSTHGVLGANSDFSHTALLEETNQERIEASQSKLTIDPKLTAAAQAKADDMATRNYWAHDTPDGKAPWAFVSAAGYNYEVAGENLAYGFNGAQEAIVGWMNSPTHRANILNADYQNVGFGIVNSPDYQGKGPQTIVVAEYGKPSTSVATVRFNVDNPPAVQTPPSVLSIDREPASQSVSRVQLLYDGQPTWTTLAVTVLMTSAILVFVTRHALYLRRLFIKGEVFVAHHPVLDFGIVTVATVGFLLTRAGGVMR
jgi:uncharacterized protein YkwD